MHKINRTNLLTDSYDFSIIYVKVNKSVDERGMVMIITATEFKTNLGKYLELAALQDIFITKNGKSIARVTSPQVNKLELLDSLVGVIPADSMDENGAREERLSRQ